MRFYWKQLPETREGGIACKIMRAVEFPFRLDISEFCTPEVRQAMNVASEGRDTRRWCATRWRASSTRTA